MLYCISLYYITLCYINTLQYILRVESWHCGAAQIVYVADEPSTAIMRVEALALWCGAKFLGSR